MRKIDQLTSEAFWRGESFSMGNTRIFSHVTIELFLHNNLIAVYSPSKNTLQIANSGYSTNVTKARLNAILSEIDYEIVQRKGVWLIGPVWDHGYLEEYNFERGIEIDLDTESIGIKQL